MWTCDNQMRIQDMCFFNENLKYPATVKIIKLQTVKRTKTVTILA